MKIYIPSLGRATRVGEGPVRQMPEYLRRDVSYVVLPEESIRYAHALCDLRMSGVDILECPHQSRDELNIAKVREWIGHLAHKCGHETFLVLDDDIRFIVRKGPDTTQLIPATELDITAMMIWVENLLRDYAHVGIGVRGGNNNVGTGDAPLLTENTRTMRALAYRTDDFLSVEHGRVQVMEDFDVNLQLLRRGLKNCCINYWCQDQKMTNAAGGCSGLRTHALHEAAAVRLAELHPGLVALRQKKNKTGGEFGTRTEVTIQWKRSFGYDLLPRV